MSDATADSEQFWYIVDTLVQEWKNNRTDTWGDALCFVAGGASEGSPLEQIFTQLLGVFLGNTPMIIRPNGDVSILVAPSTQQAIDFLSPIVKSSPHTTTSSESSSSMTYSFTIHDKHKKATEAINDVQLIGTLLPSDIKKISYIVEPETLKNYSAALHDGLINLYTERGITTIDTKDDICTVVVSAAAGYEDVKAAAAKAAKAAKKAAAASSDSPVESLISTRQRRTATRDVNYTNVEASRDEARVELARKKNELAIARLVAQGSGSKDNDDITRRAVVSYYTPTSISDYSPTRIAIDQDNDTLLLPINSQLVPFHISTIKNVTKDDLGEYTLLSIEFVTPTAKKFPPGSSANDTFVKTLQYRSKGPSLSQHLASIKVLQNSYKLKLKQMVQNSQHVEQDKLIMIKGADVVLRDIMCKPQIYVQKGKSKTGGSLTAHQNGFKYIIGDKVSGNGAYIDIIYSNIKSCYLQRASIESNLVVIHFEFIHPILIKAGKTTKFMQFYVELVEESHDLSKRNMNDQDAEEAEQEEEKRERQRRKQWNERFATFAHQVEEQWKANNQDLTIEFELPNRKMKFPGIPYKEIVDVFPTDQSLIALESNPPFVVSLAEVDCASIERVGFSLREFDLVLINKDFVRYDTIASIPTQYLDHVRSWLHDNGVLSIESKLNLQWKNLLETFRIDLLGWYQDGGWLNFFDTYDEDEDEDDDEDDEGDDESVAVTSTGDDVTGTGSDKKGDKSSKKSSKKAAQQDSDSEFEIDEDEDASSEEWSSDSDEDDEGDDTADDGDDSGQDWSDLEEAALEDDENMEKKSRDRERKAAELSD